MNLYGRNGIMVIAANTRVKLLKSENYRFQGVRLQIAHLCLRHWCRPVPAAGQAAADGTWEGSPSRTSQGPPGRCQLWCCADPGDGAGVHGASWIRTRADPGICPVCPAGLRYRLQEPVSGLRDNTTDKLASIFADYDYYFYFVN